MCGRYVMSKATGDLLSYFDAKEVKGTPPPPSWNVAPTQDVPGLYESWADPSVPEDDPARWLLSCRVPTTTTQDALGHVHDRSPVIIPRDRFAEWLDPDLTDKDDIQHLPDSLPEPTLTPRIVSTRVNSVRNTGPELIEPAE